MENKISDEKLKKYFKITKEAFAVVRKAPCTDEKEKKEIIDMAKNYISDAEHFSKKGDIVDAFAALSYAHGWLDCGARLGVYKVSDNRLFVVD